jgi:hypothetical protein
VMIEILIAAVLIAAMLIGLALLLSYGLSGSPSPSERPSAYDMPYPPGTYGWGGRTIPINGKREDDGGRR